MKLFSKIIKEGKELIGVDSVDDEEYNEEYDEDWFDVNMESQTIKSGFFELYLVSHTLDIISKTR